MSPDAERFNPVIVDFYEQIGFLPDAILNYLALLGWSLDDKREEFTPRRDDREFLAGAGEQGPGQLRSQRSSAPSRTATCSSCRWRRRLRHDAAAIWSSAGLVAAPPRPRPARKSRRLLRAADDRIKMAGDMLDYAEFFVADDQFPYDEKAAEKWLRKPQIGRAVGRGCGSGSPRPSAFEPAALEALIYQFAESSGVKIGEIVHPLRVALTGKVVGFGLFDTLAILGKDRSLARIDRAGW